MDRLIVPSAGSVSRGTGTRPYRATVRTNERRPYNDARSRTGTSQRRRECWLPDDAGWWVERRAPTEVIPTTQAAGGTSQRARHGQRERERGMDSIHNGEASAPSGALTRLLDENSTRQRRAPREGPRLRLPAGLSTVAPLLRPRTVDMPGDKAGGGGRSGRKAGGRGGRSGISAEQAQVQEQMQTLTLNGGTAAAARSEAAAARTIDGVDVLEAEPPAVAAPAAADEPSSPTASQRESAKPSVQTRLGWALNRPGLMWVLIAGRVAADTDRTVEEEVWCRVHGHEPGSDELRVEVLTDCRVLPWRRRHMLDVGLTSVREVLTRMDWLRFAEEMQSQHHSRDPMR